MPAPTHLACGLLLLAALAAAAPTLQHGAPLFGRVPITVNRTALDDYIDAPDPTYSYTILKDHAYSGPGFKAHVINMTSQTWLNENITAQSTWWHYLVIVVPSDLKFKETGLMYITGGSNTDGPPNGKSEDELLVISVALATRSVAMALFQVPNEPIYFNAEQPPHRRTEDAIIAYTWNHFMDNPSEPEWLLRLPMTKAAVRAMDTLADFCVKELQFELTKFVVAGASKRGWTTWTTGAVDSRVVGIIPMVMDLLNMHENLHHMWRNLGGWTFAFTDYYAFNFTARIDEPGLQALADVVDPYVYRERLTMPKLVIDSGGDEFFQPDDNYFWWDDMPNEKHLLMIQDAEHSLITGVPELIQSVISLVHSINTGEQRPHMTWTFNDTFDGSSIIVKCSEPPSAIYARYADTLDGERRDWRLITGQKPCPTVVVDGACLHPVLWHTAEPVEIAENTYQIGFNNPAIGWRAFFIEAKFRSDTFVPFIFTSQVNIVPHTYAFPECVGEACRGTLL